ncbi:mucin-22-like [Euwallacea similis]|uniref:mucin-22-like n=1 Tax=Euwallacea similis TaxID=1736056 RepID=UPI003450BCD6
MLQPRSWCAAAVALLLVLDSIQGLDYINTSPRKRRENDKDITTVLLVDNQGKNSLGRFLSVKPDLGLITSTARTFIQDGVTTEYATQVLGTTLDNGRLYAHLLSKTSRVVYDHDSQTKTYNQPKTWNLDESQISNKNFVRNTDFISPDSSQAYRVFPTSSLDPEILNEAQSNNARIPFVVKPPEPKVFKVNAQKDMTHENLIIHNDNPAEFKPSKVKEWDNLPTFTVRNEFSPSGFSSLGQDFEARTEKSKITTPADRKARLLFKAGLIKPNPKDLQTVTYTGFADFTTTVANTVIVFTPHTSEMPQKVAQATKILVEPTIRPTLVLSTPLATKESITTEKHYPTFLTTEEEPTTTPLTTITTEDTINTSGPNTMVINKEDRGGKYPTTDEPVDLEAKLSVLANEQKQDGVTPIVFSEDLVQPSETQPVMLSTPSHEDIARILASLQAQAAVATQPLSSVKPQETTTTSSIKTTGGATTIFFDDDDFSFDIPITTSSSNRVLPSDTPIMTTEKASVETTTELEQETTTEQQESTTTEIEIATPELAQNEIEPQCTEGSKVVVSTAYKTLTYLTTYFIPLEESTSTSVKSNILTTSQVSSETIPCGIEPSITEITTTEQTAAPVTEPITTTEQSAVPVTESIISTETEETIATTNKEMEELTTQPQEITTERKHVTESEPETTESTTEEGEEVELIFKTLYTTYTYLTTYFQDSTSSVASRIVVNTNVITSTLEPGSDASDPAVAGLLNEDESIIPSRTVTFEDLADIQPTVRPQEDPLPEEFSSATPALENKHLQNSNGVKTFYTTYTYFTTIFVDGETEISSRTEVYTNYVSPTAVDETVIAPTKLVVSADEQVLQNRLRNLKFDNQSKNRDEDNDVVPSKSLETDGYVTLKRSGDGKKEIENDIIDLSEYESIETMVTDVRSSTSKGEERIIDGIDKRNILLDDQIVSESNNESEILPSPPTVLLQTSYTTFTYFTTKYHGTTSSDIVSRLETVTNVVTTTITPTQALSTEDVSLPVTYFTTFTYWTTLYKDGQTKVTSREETVSNVATPELKSTEAPEAVIPLTITPTAVEPSPTSTIVPSTVGDDELTTYFTTYTYYTTSYIGDETVLNSRLETVTNIVNNTADVVGRAVNTGEQNKVEATETKPTGLLSTVVSTVDNNGTATLFSTEVYGTYIKGIYAKVLESTSTILSQNITPSSVVAVEPTGVVSLNQGKIIDADGVSTLLYTTQVIGTYLDGSYFQATESTSSLEVDQDKKSALGPNVPVAHRTGLVRSIEGSIVQNQTTTLYESKVLGTIIDGRYAQIIESTSSFILPSTVATKILPTATKLAEVSASVITPTPVVIESSIADSSSKAEDESSTESSDEDEDENGGRGKSRLGFQAKKRTFTPAIRPFASRQRPTFAPKRNKAGATTAATITRSDFTPTVTAVPASKANRFGGRRSSSSTNAIQATASGSRRFSRPKSTTTSRRSSATSSGFRRGGATRSSSAPSATIRPSGLFGAGNSRFRVRPTAASGLNRSPSSKIVTETPPDSENDLTTGITEGSPTDSNDNLDTTLPLQTTTESLRRSNPLLKLRRPSLNRSNPAVRTTSRPRTTSKTTTTTSRPKTTPARPNALLNRQRGGGLFPRRNLFTTTTTTEAPAEEPAEEDLNEEEEEENGDEDDTDYESSQQLTQTEAAPTTPSPKPRNGVQIRPFRRRSKRQATYSRFRRPLGRSTTTPSTTTEEIIEETRPSFRNRYQTSRYRAGKSQQQLTTPSTTTTTTQAPLRKQRISPSRSQNSRTQFTLREKDSASSRSGFSPRTGGIRRSTTAAPRANVRARGGYLQDNSARRTTARSKTRGRTNTRGRSYDQNVDDNFVLPKTDGTITVTYKIPTEVTIPVVNGKLTEYKNIVTAKLSTEVLSPNQYSTTLNPLGKEVKILLTESTFVNGNGATLVTQFILNESPTTSVIFTPTQIRGRKTSFSHVVPSTAYQVEEVVNTIQPALAAQAPLANILLSQLLLGGGVPSNPLLGIQNNPAGPATPTTEFKTRTTTYVTTVTSTLQTVIPLTFRGKEILTTISDSSTEVVTATEYFTDTVVVTPTLFGQAPQLNTLLLPLLQQQLQQQQQLQPQAALQNPANVFALNDPVAQQSFVEEEQLEQLNLADEEVQNAEEVTAAPKRKPKKSNNKRKPAKVVPPKETSVITLYVSGRTPGDFTTVLSTVTVEDGVRRKRDADYFPVKSSKAFDPLGKTEFYDGFVQPASKELDVLFEVSSKETESLESIIGDVPRHLKTKTPDLFNSKPSKATKKYSIKYVKASDDKLSKEAFLA